MKNLNYENIDCLEYLKTLKTNSIDLICTDPPYYKVVNDDWDNQWFTIDEYYEWCEEWILELEGLQNGLAAFGYLVL